MRVLLLTLLVSCGAANADMYKCKDAAGKIAYQESPCAGATVAKLKRDTSVGDPVVVAKRAAESAQFNERHTARLQMQADAAAERSKQEMEARKARAMEDQARAQEDQAAAQHEQAAALAGARAGRLNYRR